jgi:hypothetical protein
MHAMPAGSMATSCAPAPNCRPRSVLPPLLQFVSAVMDRWPRAVLQFEDFSNEHALVLLERYRQHHLVFNDDIQGTAATALAGLYGAMRRMVRRLLGQQDGCWMLIPVRAVHCLHHCGEASTASTFDSSLCVVTMQVCSDQ